MDPTPTLEPIPGPRDPAASLVVLPSAPAASPPLRPLIVIALATALVGYGLGSARPPAPLPSTPVSPSPTTAPAARAPTSCDPAADVTVQLTAPLPGHNGRRSSIRVAGTGPRDATLVVVARFGQVVVGEAVLDLREPSFELELPVTVPLGGRPIPVVLTVADASEPAVVLACRATIQSQPASVTIDADVRPARGNGVTIDVRGLAPVSARSLAVRVESLGVVLEEAVEVQPSRTPAESVVGVGRWSATFELAEPVTSSVRVDAAWTLPSGERGSREATFGP